MAPLLRRATRVSCFFCQSAPDPPPLNPRSFVCPQCACWNRYDARGDIMSDEPAMHDESLNRRSFAKRGACCFGGAFLVLGAVLPWRSGRVRSAVC